MSKQWGACPKCGNDDWGDSIDVGDWEQDCDWVWREISCKCGFEWQEAFEFTHNEDWEANELDDNGNPVEVK